MEQTCVENTRRKIREERNLGKHPPAEKLDIRRADFFFSFFIAAAIRPPQLSLSKTFRQSTRGKTKVSLCTLFNWNKDFYQPFVSSLMCHSGKNGE